MPNKDGRGPNGKGPNGKGPNGKGPIGGVCTDKDMKELDIEANKIIKSGRNKKDGTGPNPGKGIGMGGKRQGRNKK